MNTRLLRLMLLGFVLACPAVSWADYIHVVRFSGIDYQTAPWIEDGVTARGKYGIGSHTTPGAAHIDRAGTGFNSPLDFTTGSTFRAQSVLVKPIGSGYCAGDCENSSWSDPIPYIWFSGYLDGSLVGSRGIFRPSAPTFELISLDFLGNIDLLRIEAETNFDLGMTGQCNVNKGCGHFDIDDVTVVSTPEPETLALLLMGLMGTWLHRRRRHVIEIAKCGSGAVAPQLTCRCRRT